MINSPISEKETPWFVFFNLLLLGRPPWLTRKFRNVGMWLSAAVYAAIFCLYTTVSVMKIRLELDSCKVNSIHFITMGHDVFNTLCICFFVLFLFARQPDRCVELCAEFRIRNLRAFIQCVLIFVPATSVLLINTYWQTVAFPATFDLIEAIAYHSFSILVWNGLWVYICVRVFTVYDNLRKLSIESKLGSVEMLNQEIGLYLLLLFAKSVFDAISSLTFYSIQKSLPQILLLHEAGVILYDLLFCAAVAELSTRLSRDIRSDFLREAPIMTKVGWENNESE